MSQLPALQCKIDVSRPVWAELPTATYLSAYSWLHDVAQLFSGAEVDGVRAEARRVIADHGEIIDAWLDDALDALQCDRVSFPLCFDVAGAGGNAARDLFWLLIEVAMAGDQLDVPQPPPEAVAWLRVDTLRAPAAELRI